MASFIQMLNKFDMNTGSGLVFVKDKGRDEVAIEERISLETAEKYKATAVYFRRFPNGRPSIPQVYVYDYTAINFGETQKEEIAQLHKNLWNAALIPLFFVFTTTQVAIFNCHKQPEFNRITGQVKYSVLREIQMASTIENEINEFSGRLFDNGLFWESSAFKDDFRTDQSVYEKLLKELNSAKTEVIKRKILPRSIAQRILVMTILIKYLEERTDENGSTVFPNDFFSQFAEGADDFVDVLRCKGACLKLFDFLSEHFNGKIFEWKDTVERKQLSEVELNYFADFLEGKIDGQEYVLWPLYSFNHLPIELISNIYEDFLKGEQGVVYTPPYLVNFLVDEVLPLTEHNFEIKALDPACGSGVFLVAVFRRLVDRWRVLNDWKRPDLNTLKKILKNSIFGIDKDPQAVRLAVFSLNLALCDMLSPRVIWEELKFDNLFESNIVAADFFKLLETGFFQDKFDVVIGNPPFISKLTTSAAKAIEYKRQLERPPIPDGQLALLFLDQSVPLCKIGGIVCLILPAGPMLYNNTSYNFRNYFITRYSVPQIIDFSALNKVLFTSAKVSTVAVFAKNENIHLDKLLHVTVRRTKVAKEKLYFEIDHYDLHTVSYKEALENRLVWKANLLGGGRIKYLVKRLSCQRTLGEYLDDKEKKSGWKIGEGYHPIKPADKEKLISYEARYDELNEEQQKDFERLKTKYKVAEHITGKLAVRPEGLTENGIDRNYMFIEDEELFERARKEDIFNGPHVLIRKLAGKTSIPIAFVEDYLTFSGQIIGIHGPNSDISELKQIEKRIKNNKLYLFYLAACSGRYMISKQSSILKKDIIQLPYPSDEEQLKLNFVEELLINDVLEYYLNFHTKGENSGIFNKIERQDLEAYGKTYCELLNSVYKNLNAMTPIQTQYFICYPFYFKEKPKTQLSKDNIEEYLSTLLIKERANANLRILRILRIYHENVIYQIKPNLLKFWLPSIAVSDADETFCQLLEQGY